MIEPEHSYGSRKLLFFRKSVVMPIDTERLSSLLQKFVATTSDIQGVALVNSDGLPISVALPTRLDEDRVSAMAAAILALGERIGSELARGVTGRVIIEGKDGYALLTRFSEELALLVLAHRDTKLGVLIFEIKRLLPIVRKLVGVSTLPKK
jgi:predicted regulator of Ras-like GTPase activity (Roadblock/LC7/MglB family)